MRKVTFSSNTIRESQDKINQNFDEISQDIDTLKEQANTIPTKTSDLTNDGDGDSKFATLKDVDKAIDDMQLPDNLATTDYVDEEIDKLIGTASSTRDTLGELADAIQKNESVINAINASITNKANKSDVPTKTSQLTNNGDGFSKFATENYVALYGGKIDTISVNGKNQSIVNKNVDIEVPTKTSELSNDGDGTSPYSTEQYVKQVVDDLIIDYEVQSIDNGDGTQTLSINGVHDYSSGAFRMIKVEELPETNIDKNAIYLKKATTPDEESLYDEYAYTDNGWERIGQSNVLKEFDGSKETGDLRNTVYGQENGTQKNIPFANEPKANAIAQYSENGNLRAEEPIIDGDVANKKYVDDVAKGLSGQNRYIGTYKGTYSGESIQAQLSDFVQATAGRTSKAGDLVNIANAGDGVDYSGQQWIYNEELGAWKYYIDFENPEVIDNLNSESAIDGLSAKQGKVLNEKINQVDSTINTRIGDEVQILNQTINQVNSDINEKFDSDILALDNKFSNDVRILDEKIDNQKTSFEERIDNEVTDIIGIINNVNNKVDGRVNTFHATIDNSNFRYVKGSSDFTYEQVVNTENCQIEVSVANEKVYLKKQEFKNINPPDEIAGRYVGFSELIRVAGEMAELFLFVYDPENLPTDSASVENLEGWGDLQYCVSSYQPVVMGNFLDTDVEVNRTNDKNAPSTKAVGDYTDKQCGVVINYMQTTFADNIMALVADKYAPHVIYNDSTGFEASNSKAGATWHLTGLDLSPYKRIKCYVCGAGDSDSNYTPAHIVEIHLDDRAKGSFGYYSGGDAAQNPNNDNRIHFVEFIVNAEKNSIQFQRSQSLYGTAITASVGGRRCFLIEGYKI